MRFRPSQLSHRWKVWDTWKTSGNVRLSSFLHGLRQWTKHLEPLRPYLAHLSGRFQLARLSGIPVVIDYTWLPVVALHLWLLSAFYLPGQVWLIYKLPLPVWQYVFFGAIATGLFFSSVLAHEMSHALMARLEGAKILDIQLHIFGGWTRLTREPRTALGELRMAIAGPVCSFFLALFFLACRLVVQRIASQIALRETLRYLFLANLALAIFNLLPGLPLDGGRVLRAWLWHRGKDILAATQMAKRMGVAISYMLISYGIFHAFWLRDVLSAVWLIVVGIFLKTIAEREYRQRAQQRADEQADYYGRAQWDVAGTVGAAMSAPAVSLPPEMRVSEFIDQVLAAHRHTSFPVARDGRLHGILSLNRLRAVPHEDWERLTVSEVMQPVDDSLFITARASLDFAARKLRANQLQHLAVVDGDGLLVGYLSASDLERVA